jgi:CRISPR/Cas system-associated exonuclease Cas4 (RecB family)
MEDYITLMKEAREQMKSKSGTVAVKDLTLCQRQKIFKIIDPIPMTDEEMCNYVSGQAVHDAIGRLFMMFPNRFKLEMRIQYENVKGTIDIYDKLLHIVIDVKTTKSSIMLKPTRWDEQQLKYYMSMMDSEEGAVIYQMNNASKYLIFPILMNELQRKQHLAKLLEEARSFQHAIELEDPFLLDGVYDDKERNWLCKKCPYLEACNAIRKNHVNQVEVA